MLPIVVNVRLLLMLSSRLSILLLSLSAGFLSAFDDGDVWCWTAGGIKVKPSLSSHLRSRYL
jgi:hypothetical protein